MRLILTDYISSLKEDGELDELVQEVLREYDIEVVFGPERGRQFGVDVYAVGPDWTDANSRKVFLLTVKRGNLDRQNWHGSVNALQPSLQEMCTVFVRNNLLPEHVGLPVKVVVVHNGINDPAIEQNFRAFADQYPDIEFVIWQLETLANMVEEKLLSEHLFSGESRTTLRKILIYCYNPSYDLKDYKELLDGVWKEIDLEHGQRRKNVRQLRMINLVLMIVVSWCEKEGDLRLAYKVTEVTTLRFWQFLTINHAHLTDVHWQELMKLSVVRKNIVINYLNKMMPVCEVKDGFSRYCNDPVSYTLLVYEHLGMIALAGLEFLQLRDIYSKFEGSQGAVDAFSDYAANCANVVVQLLNNHNIAYHPRADDHIIEWNLVFLLLFSLGRKADIRTMMIELNQRMGQAMVFSGLAPHYNNNLEEMYELDIDYERRKTYQYHSSSLLTVLMEWTAILKDEPLFNAYHELHTKAFKNIDLTIWFPDDKTQQVMFTQRALPQSGHALTFAATMPESLEEFKQFILEDFIYNSVESEFYFFETGFWIVGLIASRHYRTYVFPCYWRVLVENTCELEKPEDVAAK